MNERIKELAEQADIGFYWDSPSIYAPVDEPPVEQAVIIPAELEKFAELIVKECVAIAHEHNNSGEGGVVAEEIKKHFGVEE